MNENNNINIKNNEKKIIGKLIDKKSIENSINNENDIYPQDTIINMQTNKEKMFSNNALFLAIPFGISILFAMKFSSIIGNFKKSKNLYFSSDISLNILFNFVANLLRNSSFVRRI